MKDEVCTEKRLERELADAHAQLLERDQRIQDLARENAALRTHLESMLRTRAWRAAEQFRRYRAKFLTL